MGFYSFISLCRLCGLLFGFFGGFCWVFLWVFLFVLRANIFTRPIEVGEDEGSFGICVVLYLCKMHIHIYINFLKFGTDKLVLFSLLPSLFKIERISSSCLLLFSVTLGSQ